MASSGGNFMDVTSNSSSNSTGGSSNPLHGEWGVPTFQHQQTISMNWTPEEQTKLEEGMVKYASESNIIRYAKIAVDLQNKSVRDVALRFKWMARKENSKRRKEDLYTRRGKDKKEKFVYPPEQTCHLAVQQQAASSFPPDWISGCNGDAISFNDMVGSTQRLLHQNSWALEQISANLAVHQTSDNIGLLSQVRDNILIILSNLKEMGRSLRQMPPLPKLNEELARTILPLPLPLPIQ